MVISQLNGGLGNQLFQYATAFSLAKALNTSYIFDKSLFDKEITIRKIQLEKFNVPFKTINQFSLKLLTDQKKIKIDNRHYNPFFHEVICDPIWQKVDLRSKGKRVYLKGYWPYLDYFKENKDYLRKGFTIRDSFKTNAFDKMLLSIISSESVSIHIRLEDYQTDSSRSLFGMQSPDYYAQAIHYIETKIPNPSYFIFTDNIELVKSEYNLPATAVFIAEQNIETDYLEFELMRNSKHNIIANSTFSWWASFLNNNPDKIVIQPAKWYNDQNAQLVYQSREILFNQEAIFI